MIEGGLSSYIRGGLLAVPSQMAEMVQAETGGAISHFSGIQGVVTTGGLGCQ